MFHHCLLREICRFGIGFLASLSISVSSFASPISVTKTKDLEFGKFITWFGNSGTVTVDPSGRRFSSGGVRLIGATSSAARFRLQGVPGTHYTVTLPSMLTLVSDGVELHVSGITASVPTTGVLPEDGVLHLDVGGTLAVNGAPQSGTYSCSFTISVE